MRFFRNKILLKAVYNFKPVKILFQIGQEIRVVEQILEFREAKAP